MEKITYLPIKDFVDLGYLQEINRLLLHPCGLALQVDIDEKGEYSFGGVWDYRKDNEGIVYSEGTISNIKIKSVQKEMDKHSLHRINLLGKAIQE